MHHIFCNYQNGPVGGKGCICVVVTKKEKKELENVRQIIQDWLNHEGHNRFWYHPELLAKLAETLELQPNSEPLRSVSSIYYYHIDQNLREYCKD